MARYSRNWTSDHNLCLEVYLSKRMIQKCVFFDQFHLSCVPFLMVSRLLPDYGKNVWASHHAVARLSLPLKIAWFPDMSARKAPHVSQTSHSWDSWFILLEILTGRLSCEQTLRSSLHFETFKEVELNCSIDKKCRRLMDRIFAKEAKSRQIESQLCEVCVPDRGRSSWISTYAVIPVASYKQTVVMSYSTKLWREWMATSRCAAASKHRPGNVHLPPETLSRRC